MNNMLENQWGTAAFQEKLIGRENFRYRYPENDEPEEWKFKHNICCLPIYKVSSYSILALREI